MKKFTVAWSWASYSGKETVTALNQELAISITKDRIAQRYSVSRYVVEAEVVNVRSS